MSDQKKPMYEITGGRGTMADPYVLTSNLYNFIQRIPSGAYDYVPGQLAQARKMLAETDVSDETRASIEARLTLIEYRWHFGRASYLRERSRMCRPQQVEAFLKRAEAAEAAFREFSGLHPELHESETRRREGIRRTDELLRRMRNQ